MRFMKIIISLLFLVNFHLAQNGKTHSHPFSKSLAITGEGGITIGDTDFPDTKIDYFGRGMLEYFFPTQSTSIIGLRLFAGGGYISGSGLSINDPPYSDINEFQTKIVFGGAGVVYSYSLGRILQPYLAAKVSYLIFNPLGADGKNLPRNAQAEYAKEEIDYMGEFGIRFIISNRISFNVGYNFNYVDNDNLDDIYSSKNDIFHKIIGGFTYYFKFDNDSDNDGVKDSYDLCSDTPEGIEVDDFGCAKDTDGDNVPDQLDLCSNTPQGVDVDSNGCPYDSDNDGIFDSIDKCPDTKPNVKVDEFGCEELVVNTEIKEEKKEPVIVRMPFMIEEEVKIDSKVGSVVFNFGDHNLLPDPKTGLDKLVDYIKSNPESEWVITGHTDPTGPTAVNIRLSEDRANTIKDYLIEKGISEQRLEVIVVGSDIPFGDNTLQFGRKLNRRVTIEEKNFYEKKDEMLTTNISENYDTHNEYNIESYIFTDGNFYCIQVSSWKRKYKAEQEVEKLKSQGHSAFIVEARPPHKSGIWYRVRVGYFNNLFGAREYQKRLP